MIDPDRTQQSVYAMFQGNKAHADATIREVQDFLETHFAEKITVEPLAERFHLVRRTLERRFKAATGLSILSYLQQLRVEAAKQALEQGKKSVTEVMFDCGYHDPKAFREVFKKIVGMSPLAYRKRFEGRLVG